MAERDPAEVDQIARVHGLVEDDADDLDRAMRSIADCLFDDAAGLGDLGDDLARYTLAMRMPWIRGLLDAGVSPRTVARLSGLGAIGRVRALEKDGLWSEAEDGAARLVLAVWEPSGLIDLVALSSGNPDAWSLRRGDAVVLGWSAIERAGVLGEPLRLASTPLSWLAGGCVGACVLRWCPEALGLLRGLGSGVTLLCDDDRAAAALGDALRWRGLPRVGVAEQVGEIAA